MRQYRNDELVDFVIVGTGAGGGTLACRLAEHGFSVVALDAGPYFRPLEDFASDESEQTKLYWTDDRIVDGAEPLQMGSNNSGKAVGGSTVHFAMVSLRFRPEWFKSRTLLGYGADWPLDWREMWAYYAYVEDALKIAGPISYPWGPHRPRYPYRAHELNAAARALADGCEALGIRWTETPIATLSAPRGLAHPCVYRGFCVTGCATNAKQSALVTWIPRAIAAGAEIRDLAMVGRIEADNSDLATGVHYHREDRWQFQRARNVVVAGYAIETPRLLLRTGIGGDNVGRYLTYHYQTFTVGIFERDTGGERGRSVTHLHDDLMIDTPEMRKAAAEGGLPWVRGGTTEHGSGRGVIDEALTYGRGRHHTKAMADSALRRRIWAFTMQGEDVPQFTNRVDLDPSVKDAWGFPAGRVTYKPHRHELVASDYGARVHEAVMRDAGAEAAFSATSPRGDEPPESRHVMGTARMGTSPDTSVVDSSQRLWDVDNVVVCDSSVFVTSAGYNPTLTLAALAHRAATLLASGGSAS